MLLFGGGVAAGTLVGGGDGDVSTSDQDGSAPVDNGVTGAEPLKPPP